MRPRKQLDINFILDEYFNKEKSMEEIGKELNTHHQTIKRNIIERGFSLRQNPYGTERFKQKRRDAQIRLFQNPDYRRNIVESHLGKPSWNKGLTKATDNRIKTPHSAFKKGQDSWRKGLTMEDPRIKESILKMVESRKLNGSYIQTDKQKENISKSLKGKPKSPEHIKNVISSLIGKKYSKELYPKWGWRTSRKNQIFPLKDTSIEIKIQKFLEELKIEFFTHKYIKEIKHGYQCDILIPSMNMVIECDGNYWHKYPIGNEIDHIRTKELIEKGFKVLRLWEFEINKMSIDEFKERLNGK